MAALASPLPPLSAGCSFLLFCVLLPGVLAAVDDGHFAVELPYASDGMPPFVDFLSPSYGAPSYILAGGQLGPPYDAKQFRPISLGCDASWATPCAIEAAIQLVTRGKVSICQRYQEVGLHGGFQEAAVNATADFGSGVKSLGLLVLSDDFQILGDALRPDLLGSPLDGLNASGRSIQPRFRERVLWAVGANGSSSEGGFVPHLSTRFPPTGVADESDGYAAASAISTYFERCSGTSSSPSSLFVGASVRRAALPMEEACDSERNLACNLRNAERMIGLSLLDFLSVKGEEGYQQFLYNLAYTDMFSVNSQTPLLSQISPDPADTDSLLNPTYCTILADRPNRSKHGQNTSEVSTSLGAGVLGGQSWVKYLRSYREPTMYELYGYEWMKDLDPPSETEYWYEVHLVAGVVLDQTAHALAVGFDHRPQTPPTDFQCGECDSAFLSSCAIQTVQYLSSHGETDFLVADSEEGALWRISNLRWLGSNHDAAEDLEINNYTLESPWPAGFSLAIFDESGVCLAHGATPLAVGKDFASIIREQAQLDGTWSKMWERAQMGIGWMNYTGAAGAELAKLTRLNRFGKQYLMVSAIPATPPTLGECSFTIVEPCVGEWMEVELARWAALLGVLDPSQWKYGLATLLMEFPHSDSLWAGAYDENWESLLRLNDWSMPLSPRRLVMDLTEDKIASLETVLSTRGGWVVMPDSTSDNPHKALVLAFRHNASKEVRIVAGFTGPLGSPTCDKGCGFGQFCGDDGLCACPMWKSTSVFMQDPCNAGFGETVVSCWGWETVHPSDCNLTDIEHCNVCREGYYCPNNYVFFECPVGYYCPEKSRTPLPCPQGTWSNETTSANESDCLPCSEGAYRDLSMLEGCSVCPAGSFQPQEGQSKCERCGRGLYQSSTGQSSCLSCDDGKTTDGVGYLSAEDCVCPPNTYTVNTASGELQCRACGEGSHCPGYGAEPEALAGYYLDAVSDDDLSIFQCLESSHCPGGPARSCARGRSGIACSQCDEHKTPENSGGCRDCVFLDKFLLWGALLGFAVALIILYQGVATADRARQNHSTLLAVICASQIVTLVQTLVVLASMQIEWREPLKALLEAFRFLAFDFGELRLSCHFTLTPLQSYLSRLLVPVVAIAFVSILHSLSTCFFYFGHLRSRFPVFLGAVGSVFMVFSISIVLATLQPVQCMRHPNDRWTMRKEMSELCWEGDDHTLMVLAAGVASLLPLLFLASVIYILNVFPHKVREGNVRFLNTTQFLLLRYKPNRRWCALFLICRNMLVAVVPTFPDPVFQVVLLQSISLLGLVVIQQFQPCRVFLVNVSEAALSIGTLLAGSLASFFIDDPYLVSISRLAMQLLRLQQHQQACFVRHIHPGLQRPRARVQNARRNHCGHREHGGSLFGAHPH